MLNFSKNGSDRTEVHNCYRTYIVTKPTESYIINSIMGCIVNLILCFFGTFLNALVISVFWKTPTLRYKISYFMIMLLSSIDILVTLVVHPSHVFMSITEIVGRPSCVCKLYYHVVAILFSGMSFVTLFVMNIERYLSIVHPLFHLKHITKLRCLMICSIFWAIVIFVATARTLRLDIQLLITVLTLIVTIGTCYIYMAIFRTARNSKKMRLKMKGSSSSVRKFDENDSEALSERNELKTRSHNPPLKTNFQKKYEKSLPEKSSARKRSMVKKQNKSPTLASSKTVSFLHDLQLAKMYLLVVFSSFILNLPNALLLAIFKGDLGSVDGLVQSKVWTVTLVLMNSTVNCLIFFWANNRLRKEGWKVCKSMCTRRILKLG